MPSAYRDERENASALAAIEPRVTAPAPSPGGRARGGVSVSFAEDALADEMDKHGDALVRAASS